MIIIILKDATSGVVDQSDSILAADVGEGERAHHIGPDGLHLVRLAPVDVGAAGDAGGVEYVGRTGVGDVGGELGAVLEPAVAVGEVDAPGAAKATKEATDPACAAVDQNLERLLRSAAVGLGGAHRWRRWREWEAGVSMGVRKELN